MIPGAAESDDPSLGRSGLRTSGRAPKDRRQHGTENQQGSQFQTPNLALVNADGFATNDRTHEFKTYMSYQVPSVDVSLNAYYRFLSGTTFNPVQRSSRAA